MEVLRKLMNANTNEGSNFGKLSELCLTCAASSCELYLSLRFCLKSPTMAEPRLIALIRADTQRQSDVCDLLLVSAGVCAFDCLRSTPRLIV